MNTDQTAPRSGLIWVQIVRYIGYISREREREQMTKTVTDKNMFLNIFLSRAMEQCSAWRNSSSGWFISSLLIFKTGRSKDSDQSDLSLCFQHTDFVWFCHVMAYIVLCISLRNTRTALMQFPVYNRSFESVCENRSFRKIPSKNNWQLYLFLSPEIKWTWLINTEWNLKFLKHCVGLVYHSS